MSELKPSLDNYPKISCLTITKNRLVLLKQAIECFERQTYPNKELVIISDGVDYFNHSIQRYLDEKSPDNIVFKVIKGKNKSLGELRNMAWDMATGDLICQWDDDDQYHPQRLEIQYLHLKEQGAQVSFLVEQLQLFCGDQILFLIDGSNTTEIRKQLIPGTLMAYHSDQLKYPVSEEEERKGLIDQLLDKGADIVGLSGQARLHLHQYHGSNTHTKDHHLELATSRSASETKVMQQLPEIYQALQQYNVPSPLGIYSTNKQIGIYNQN